MMRSFLSSASSLTLAAALAPAAFGQTEQSPRIEQIVVTATKREQTAQTIPVAVQAIDETTLDALNIGNFDDYVRYLPNVNFGGRGPGQSTVFIRGLAVQPITVLLSGAQGTVPNVALYLDEQPVTAPGRNLDVYAADLERVEILPGPQGTLFGASSQAGTVRLITNKPQFDGVSAGVESSVAFTENGEMSTGVEAVLNVPVIEDKFAVRGVVYSIQEGGFIDNVVGEFTLDPSINPDSQATPDAVFYETINNADIAEDDFNGASYEGVRLSALYAFNDDWDLLVQHTRQQLEVDGVFDFDPEVGDLEVTRFFDDTLDDEFAQTSWTVEGRLAMLDVIYTGSYLKREINQSVDYTGYNNSGGFISYYTCTYDNPAYIVNYGIDPRFITPGGRECLDPTKGAVIQQDQTRNTHEFRFNTPADRRLRVTAGVFYDDFEIETQDDFFYLATPDLGFAPNAPISDAVQVNPATRPSGVAFFNDIRRTEEQIAGFGEVAFDIVPNTLTATFGARVYNIESDFEGSSNFADGIFQGSVNTDRGRDYDSAGSGGDPNAPPTPGASDPNVPGHSTDTLTTEGEVFKFNLSWTPRPGLLFFGTYSEGFRPGGFNRGGGVFSLDVLPENVDGDRAFPTVETTFDTDDVTNWELGWKTLLFGGAVQFNGAAYFIEWTDMQISRFDPQNVSILTFIENGADSEILGVEGDVIWAATDNLTLFGAFSYNDTELTSVNAEIVELAPVGSELPLVPTFQAVGRARYDWRLADYDAYVQGAVQYAGESFSSLVAEVREQQDAYTTLDASFGVSRDQWAAELFIENLTDERAELFINEQDDIRRITTNRPRTVGLRLSVDL